MHSNTRKGIQLAIVTALVSGVAIFINKFAVGVITPPLVFTATKNIGVGLLIVTFLIGRKKVKLLKNLTQRELVFLAFIGIIGGAIPFYLFFTGLSMIPAINAALIHKTMILWVAVGAVLFLNEKISKTQVLAVLILFASNFVVGGFNGFSFALGEIYVLAATILWSVESILAKKILPTVDPDIVTAARMGLGSLLLLGVSVVYAPAGLAKILTLTSLQWFWMVATMTTLLAYVMTWYRALKYAPAITVAVVLVSSTLVTNILSAIFITHTLNTSFLIQAGLIILGLGIFGFTVKKEFNQSLRSNLGGV